ncbi:hypothetical protein Pmani_008873 [Petrolisthes manimaculis]|uniref:Uncharacterized protein n=1 Tax=Petrolisthes manimaculis TaxID=1843537 RepID=A0AAE1Q5Z0_9EUCA|nr:hypothetical protein Pmani_008873 [Petrolisthes manimaculis]
MPGCLSPEPRLWHPHYTFFLHGPSTSVCPSPYTPDSLLYSTPCFLLAIPGHFSILLTPLLSLPGPTPVPPHSTSPYLSLAPLPAVPRLPTPTVRPLFPPCLGGAVTGWPRGVAPRSLEKSTKSVE